MFAENLMPNLIVREIIEVFATRDSVFKANSASATNTEIGNSLQGPCKGKSKEISDMPLLESYFGWFDDSSSESNSNCVKSSVARNQENFRDNSKPRYTIQRIRSIVISILSETLQKRKEVNVGIETTRIRIKG